MIAQLSSKRIDVESSRRRSAVIVGRPRRNLFGAKRKAPAEEFYSIMPFDDFRQTRNLWPETIDLQLRQRHCDAPGAPVGIIEAAKAFAMWPS